MRVKFINKESMFKLVKTFAGSVYDMDRDDYFAMAKDIEKCKFELDKDKAVLRFKGVEEYPEGYEGERVQEDEEYTTATLFRDGYEGYDEKCFKLEVKVMLSSEADEYYIIGCEAGQELCELCGMKTGQ